MKKIEFEEITEKDYQSFETKAQSVDFMQSSAMAKVQKTHGYDNHFFLGSNENQPVLMANLTSIKVLGGLKYQLRYGPIFLDGQWDEAAFSEFLNYLKTYVKKHEGIELKVAPNLNYQKFDDSGEATSVANDTFLSEMKALEFEAASPWIGYDEEGAIWHYVKDLSNLTDEKSLLKSYSRDGQYSVKLTRQFGIEIRQLSYEELPDFKKITEATSERRGYNDRDLAYFQSFYKFFKEKARYLVAEINFQTYAENLKKKVKNLQEQIDKSSSAKKQKQREEWQSQINSQEKRLREVSPFLEKYKNRPIILAGALFVESGDEMVYLFSGSYEEFKPFYAPFAIQHFVMTDALERAFKRYNFYGVSGILDGSDGVLHFKQNFGGYTVKKVGSFRYLPKRTKYKAIQLVKGILRRN